MELPRQTQRINQEKKRNDLRAFSTGTVLFLMSSLGSFFLPEYESKAATLNVLETLGIGIVAGTVLGASTLPFYDEPGQHTGNIALGAAIGAGVGLGIVLVRSIVGSGGGSESMAGEAQPSGFDIPSSVLSDKGSPPKMSARAEHSFHKEFSSWILDPALVAANRNLIRAPLASLPLVSLRW